MADIPSFLIGWWYAPDTKLAITFNTIGANITQGNVTGTLNNLNGLSASVEENYRLENTITNHPVETGVSIGDHIIPQPQIITITGLLTAINVIPLVGTGILSFTQLGNAIKFLFSAATERTLFTLTTGLYFGDSFYRKDKLAIQSIDIPRNNQYGRTSIRFTIVFKEIIITKTNAPTRNSSSQASLDANDEGII